MSTGYTSSLSDLTGVLNVLNGTITGLNLVSLGTLNVNGATTLAALTATTINATGAVTTGPLTSATLTCTGAANTGALTALSISTSGTATTGALTSSSISTTGTASTGALTATSATVNGPLTASGATSLTGATSVANTLTQTGSSNAVSFAGPTTISNTLTQTGATNAVALAGPVSLANTLSASGAATFSSTVSTGALTAASISTSGSVSSGPLSAASVSVSGTLTVTGASALNGATTVANTFTQTGSTNVVSLAGPTTISNVLTLGSQVTYPNSMISSTAADTTVAGNSIRFRNTDATNSACRVSVGNSVATGNYDSRFLAYTLGTSPDVSTNYERLEIGGNGSGAFIQYAVGGTGTIKSLNVYGSTVFAPTGAVAFSGPVTHTNSITQSGGAVSLAGATTLGSTLSVAGLVTATAGAALPGSSIINFGSDQTKTTNAGQIGYQLSTVGAVDFYGAGTAIGSRTIKLWDNIIVPGTINPASGASIGQISSSATSSATATTFKGTGVKVGPGFDSAGTSHTIPLGSVLGDNFSVVIMVFAGNKKTTGAKTGLLIVTVNKSAGYSGSVSTIVSSSSNISNLSSSLNSSSDVVITTDSDCAVSYTQFIGS